MGLFSVNKSSSTTQLATTNNYDQRSVSDASGGGVIGSGDTTNSHNAVNSGNSWFDLTQLTTSNTQHNTTNTSNDWSSSNSNSGNTSASWTDGSNRSTNDSGNTSAFWADGSNRSTNDSGNTSAVWTSANRSSAVDNSNRSSTNNYTSTGTDPGVSHIADTNAALLATLGHQQGDAMGVIAGLGTAGIRQMGESATSLFGQAEQNSATVWTNTLNASQDMLGKMFAASSNILGAGTTLAQGAMATYQPADSKNSDNQVKIALLGAAAILVAAFISKRKG